MNSGQRLGIYTRGRTIPRAIFHSLLRRIWHIVVARYTPNGCAVPRGDFSSRWTCIRCCDNDGRTDEWTNARCPGIDQGPSRSAKIAGPFVIVGGIPRRFPIGEISKSASNVGSSALLRGKGRKVGQSRLSLRSMFRGNSYNDILAYFVSRGVLSENAVVLLALRPCRWNALRSLVARMQLPRYRRNDHLFPRNVRQVKRTIRSKCSCSHSAFVLKSAWSRGKALLNALRVAERTLIIVDSKFAGTLNGEPLANFVLYNCKSTLNAACDLQTRLEERATTWSFLIYKISHLTLTVF